ncbi:MAG: nucleotidyltransferase domain-containing protein [Patescibacteria group bacterium]
MKLAAKGLSRGEIAAFCYADIFGVILTRAQAKRWSIKTKNPLALPVLHPNLSKKKSYAQIKTTIAQKIIKNFISLPFVEAIFLTGDIATGICTKDSDIDLMIVTKPHTLWLTRLLLVWYLKNKKIYKNLICPNIFLDAEHLQIKEHNLYTAHEVLQARCLFDRNNIESKWLKLNSWTKNYLPNAYGFKISNLKIKNSLEIENWKLEILLPFEFLVFIFQYLYMKSKMTNEQVGLGFAFFHPRKLSSHVLQEYQKRLELAK